MVELAACLVHTQYQRCEPDSFFRASYGDGNVQNLIAAKDGVLELSRVFVRGCSKEQQVLRAYSRSRLAVQLPGTAKDAKSAKVGGALE